MPVDKNLYVAFLSLQIWNYSYQSYQISMCLAVDSLDQICTGTMYWYTILKHILMRNTVL